MDPGSREEKNSLSFLDVLAKDNGLELREPGYMMYLNLKLLQLSFGKGKEAGAKERESMAAAALLDEIHTFFFLQAAPGIAVARAVRAFRKALATQSREEAFEAFMTEHVDPFMLELSAEKKSV